MPHYVSIRGPEAGGLLPNDEPYDADRLLHGGLVQLSTCEQAQVPATQA